MADEKTCSRCKNVLPLSEFRRNRLMKDGHSRLCKDCDKAQDMAYRAKNRERFLAYDRARRAKNRERLTEYYRANSERRAEDQRRHRSRPEVKALRAERARIDRERHPEKSRARIAVSNAISAGRIVRQPCQFCGATKTQAHHEDYSKPLDVVWVCPRRHYEHFHAQRDEVQK